MIVLLACPMVGPTHADAQGPAGCALQLEARVAGPAAYQQRSGRCEGVYVRPVAAGSRLLLRGYHLATPTYILKSDDRVTVRVIGLAGARPSGVLLARSIRPRHYYQMDTRELSADGSFIWDTTILRSKGVELEGSELAVVYAQEDATDPRIAHVWPVRVEGRQGARAATVPFLIVESEVELAEVVLTVRDAVSGKPVVDQQPLGRLSYPPGFPIRVLLNVDRPGQYAVTLASIARSGAAGQLDLVAMVPREALGR